jgi:hypothetical protein
LYAEGSASFGLASCGGFDSDRNGAVSGVVDSDEVSGGGLAEPGFPACAVLFTFATYLAISAMTTIPASAVHSAIHRFRWVEPAVDLAVGVDRDHVRAAQPRHDLRLAAKPRVEGFVRHVGVKRLFSATVRSRTVS